MDARDEGQVKRNDSREETQGNNIPICWGLLVQARPMLARLRGRRSAAYPPWLLLRLRRSGLHLRPSRPPTLRRRPQAQHPRQGTRPHSRPMNQHITQDQFKELSVWNQLKARAIFDPLGHPSQPDPLPTVGEMIEYLTTTDYYRPGQQQHWLDIGGLD